MTVSYNLDIPAASNPPSVDQPNMLTNTNAVDTILNVDHVSFNTASGGTHKQVTFSSKNTPGAQTDPSSTLYTADGTTVAVAQLFFRNQTGIWPINIVRAFGSFNGSTGATIGTALNCSCARTATGTYTITLTANAVGSADVSVLATVLDGGNRFATYTNLSYGAGVLTFAVNVWLSDQSGIKQDRNFSVMVLQL